MDYPFRLDPFQELAIEHLDAGRSVLVAAPTGAGKTVVAEHAVAMALAAGRKAFYTTPIKALSNQKYHDLAVRHGADRVGLLTGDNSVNGEAPIVVMTTEVLRNMLYADSPTLRGLDHVVLDEVHYLQDRYRGPVWEEVIVHTPPAVRLVCLSATVSNADELAAWLRTVRGPTEVVLHTERPVTLENLYLVGDRTAPDPHLLPVLVDGKPNPEASRFDADQPRRGRRGRRPRRRFFTPSRAEVVECLAQEQLLPAIVFVFSRAGCDDAVRATIATGIRLTTPEEARPIQAIVERRVAGLSQRERNVFGYAHFLQALEKGIAAHHAGMIPAFKEAVEECFAAGLVKLVFATETLALGINMPARATVIERLTKFNGDTHEFLTPLEFTQLTGRAGRRGIDEVGSAIVLWSPFVAFDQVAEVAASRAFPLRSAFRPNYNMAANLVRRHDRDEAHRLLNLSFAQYQADAEVVSLQRRVDREAAALGRAEEQARCERGDVGEYLSRRERADQAASAVNGRDVATALAALRPGQVISVPTGRGSEPGAVLSVSYRSGGRIKVRAVTRSHDRITVGIGDFADPPVVLGEVDLPDPYRPNNTSFQHEVIRRLHRARLGRGRRARRARDSDTEANPIEDHPVIGCPDLDLHVRAAREVRRRRAALDRLRRRRTSRAADMARQFDDIVGLLEARGYIADWGLTPAGEVLTSIFHESDLAIAEALRLGLFEGLDPASLAGLVSCFTYEHRGRSPSVPPRLRSAELRRRFLEVEEVVAGLRADEREAGLVLTSETDPGFAAVATGWAAGEPLDLVVDVDEMTGGDFVRQARQLIDVLRQIGGCAPEPATAAVARAAADSLQRGVVATSSPLESGAPEDDAGADRQG